MNQPRGIFSTTVLTNAALAVSAGGTFISGWRATGGAGAQVIIFRKAGAGTEFFRAAVPINGIVVSPPGGFWAEGGLEVLTVGAAADVNLNVFYTLA